MKKWWEKRLRLWADQIRRDRTRQEVIKQLDMWVKYGMGGNLDQAIDDLEMAYFDEYNIAHWHAPGLVTRAGLRASGLDHRPGV